QTSLRIQIADVIQDTLIHSPQTGAGRSRSRSHLVRPIPYHEDVSRILIRSLDLNPFRDTLIYCRSTPVTECPISARQAAVTQTHITHSKNSNIHNNRLKA